MTDLLAGIVLSRRSMKGRCPIAPPVDFILLVDIGASFCRSVFVLSGLPPIIVWNEFMVNYVLFALSIYSAILLLKRHVIGLYLALSATFLAVATIALDVQHIITVLNADSMDVLFIPFNAAVIVGRLLHNGLYLVLLAKFRHLVQKPATAQHRKVARVLLFASIPALLLLAYPAIISLGARF